MRTMVVLQGMRLALVGVIIGAPVTAIDVAVAPISWLAVVAGGRAVALPNYRGDRLMVTTWHFGLRLQTYR
jgi:hypothetical protein